MSLFKRLFGAKKSAPYGTFPSLPTVPLELPKSPRRSIPVGKYTLEEKLSRLTQVRPQREALLWQGRSEGECIFYAFVKTNDENHKWLVERLGGGEVLEEALWGEMQSLKVLLGLSRQLSCLSFKFTLDSRYRLEYRLYADEFEEVWVALDVAKRERVLVTTVRPQEEGKVAEDFRTRGSFDFEPASFPGLLPLCGEGMVKTLGPFAAYRYRFPRLLYSVTETPLSPIPASWLLSQRQLSLEEAITILYEVGRVLASLHEQGWYHGKIAPQHLLLASGGPLCLISASARGQEPLRGNDISVYLNGFSLRRIGDQSSFSRADEALQGFASAQKGEAGRDQYLLALAVYKLASGKIPSGEEVIPLHEVSPRFPAWFSGILARMLDPMSDRRFPGMREMIAALAQELKDPEWTEGEEIVSASPKSQPLPEKKEPVVLEPKKSKPDQAGVPDTSEAGESLLPAASEESSDGEFEEFAASPLILDSYLLYYPYQPFLLHSDEVFRIGRGKDNDLILSSEDVSSSHAVILREKEHYLLKDQGSSNGTMVNGQPVHDHILTHGDKITIGANTIVYQEIAQGRLPEDADQKLLLKKTLRMPSLRKGKADVYTSLSGDLSQISLWQVVQMLAGEEKTGALIISAEEEIKFFFVQGTVVHCESETEKGRELFYRQVLSQQGTFEFNPDMAPREITMSDAVESLLLEAARRLDEQERQS